MLDKQSPAGRKWTSWRSFSLYGLLVLLFFETVSGGYLWVIPELGKGPMIMLGLHLVLGVVAVVPALIFLYKHLRFVWSRDDTTNRPVDVFLRHTAWVGLLVSLVTGIYLFIVGVSFHELGWWVHVVLSFVGVLATGVHMAYGTLAARRRLSLPVSMQRLGWRAAAGTVVLVGLTAGSIMLFQHLTRFQVRPNYEAARAEELFQPGAMTTSFDGLASPGVYSNSVACGSSGCHQGLYQEWLETPHYRSANPLVLNVVDRVRREVGGHSAQRHCGACHYPTQLITGNTEVLADPHEATPPAPLDDHQATPEIPTAGAQPNPKAVLDMPGDEGSSCIFCHSIGELRKAGGGSNIIDAPREYVFASGTPWSNWLYERAVAMKPKAHGRSYTRDFYHESKACAGCHQRLQMESWVHSQYFASKDPKVHKECQACHMPDIALDNEVMTTIRGKTKSHRFPGANVFLPEYYGAKTQAEVTTKFLQDKKVEMAGTVPPQVAPGAKMPLRVSLFNKAVGHIYPAGPEIDLVEAWIEIHVKDDKGREVWSSGVPDDKHHLPRGSYVYTMWGFDQFLKPVPKRYGLHHPTWHWTYGMLHVIPAGKVDDADFDVQLPADLATGPLHIEVAVQQRKPVQTFMDIAMPGKTAPIVTLAKWNGDVAVEPTAKPLALAPPPFPNEPRCDPFYIRRITRRELYIMLSSYQAIMEVNAGKVADAIARLTRVREIYGTELYDLSVAWGIALGADGKERQAQHQLEDVLDRRREDTLARMSLADLYEKDGRTEDAARLRAEAANLKKNAGLNYFSTFEQEVIIDNGERAQRLKDEIARGTYDKQLPFELMNRRRLREVQAADEPDWALRE